MVAVNCLVGSTRFVKWTSVIHTLSLSSCVCTLLLSTLFAPVAYVGRGPKREH
jgi:hypothetical protein